MLLISRATANPVQHLTLFVCTQQRGVAVSAASVLLCSCRDALAANAAALLAAVSALPGASVTGAKDSPLIHLRIGPGAIPASEAQGRRDSGAAAAARMLGESGILSEAAQEVRMRLPTASGFLARVLTVREDCFIAKRLTAIFSPMRPCVSAARQALLLKVCDRAKAKHGVLIATAKYSPLERQRPPPSIRITVRSRNGWARARLLGLVRVVCALMLMMDVRGACARFFPGERGAHEAGHREGGGGDKGGVGSGGEATVGVSQSPPFVYCTQLRCCYFLVTTSAPPANLATTTAPASARATISQCRLKCPSAATNWCC